MKYVQILLISLFVAACAGSLKLAPPPQDPLIAKGRELFFNETFGGNGRTCGTCHRAENNFTIDPSFISTLPPNDPLFVAEFIPELKENFENPKLMREVGLIKENLDGFDDLKNKFTMRGVPHTLGLSNTVTSSAGPHTGWSGDGAPGDRSLRSFATGAVIQHFTKTLNRIAGVDFRLPTDAELDALEAFQLSLGTKQELNLPLPLKNPVALKGQTIFNDIETGKCFVCHSNAGANVSPGFFGAATGNLNFNTGVEKLPDQPGHLFGELNPPDDGFGTPGDSTFNVPSLIEAAETGPFFHNNSVETIEGAVAFYDGNSFNESPAGKLLDSLTGGPVEIDATQIVAVAAFLRVINALENIRESKDFLNSFLKRSFSGNELFDQLPDRAGHETRDAVRVLTEGRLHPAAVVHLRNVLASIEKAKKKRSGLKQNIENALAELDLANDELISKNNAVKK
jgi:cytochrome c peroxidase